MVGLRMFSMYSSPLILPNNPFKSRYVLPLDVFCFLKCRLCVSVRCVYIWDYLFSRANCFYQLSNKYNAVLYCVRLWFSVWFRFMQRPHNLALLLWGEQECLARGLLAAYAEMIKFYYCFCYALGITMKPLVNKVCLKESLLCFT